MCPSMLVPVVIVTRNMLVVAKAIDSGGVSVPAKGVTCGSYLIGSSTRLTTPAASPLLGPVWLAGGCWGNLISGDRRCVPCVASALRRPGT